MNCGANRPDGWVHPNCPRCREIVLRSKRNRRVAAKRDRKCSLCGCHLSPTWQWTKCKECRRNQSEVSLKLKSQREAAGVCLQCGSGRAPQRRMCSDCLVKVAATQDGRASDAIRNGLCRYCIKRSCSIDMPSCDECRTGQAKKRHDLKLLVMSKYGGAACKCCGETRIQFLQIDHIDGNGGEHRRTVRGATNICRWLKARKFPPGFQVLCANCNLAKSVYGECPHEKERRHEAADRASDS